MKYHGVLPELPAVATSSGADRTTLTNYLNQVADDPAGEQKRHLLGRQGPRPRGPDRRDRRPAGRDRHPGQGADGHEGAPCTNWFTASAGETDHLFYYDQNWGTLIGYAASYGSDQELNDHHFHYGYFIAAAATLAKFDPAWATDQPVRRHGRPADPRRQQLRPRRHPLPVPAGLRHLRRSRLGVGPRLVRLRQQPGVQLGGDELRRRPDPVGPGDRQHRGARRRHLHLHHPVGGDRRVLVRRRQRRLPGPVRPQRPSGWCGATAARTPPGSPPTRRRSRASTSCRSPAATSTWACTRPTTRSTTTRSSATAAANPPPGRTSSGSSWPSAIPISR